MAQEPANRADLHGDKWKNGLLNCVSLAPPNRNRPIQNFPADTVARLVAAPDPRLIRDDDLPTTQGPATVVERATPHSVVLTVESLGDDDPALVAQPQLPVVFIFDAPALAKLRLSSKRPVFFVETLQDLAERREVIVHLGDPKQITSDLDAAITWAPVPSCEKYARTAVGIHPWAWLAEPHAGSVRSFSAWRQKLTLPK